MALTPGEADRLLLHVQASLAQRRRDRGLRLNVPEATALLADAVCEWARDGLSLTETLGRARAMLTVDDVLPGVPGAVAEVRVEARFDDGTRLVVVRDPFGITADADEVPSAGPTPEAFLEIRNEATTAIGLTSHIHLAEVNPRLRLDRAGAFGMRPAIATGETVWVRPGETLRLPVTSIRGARVVVGNTGLVDGPLDDPDVRAQALASLRACGFLDIVEGAPLGDAPSAENAIPAVMRARTAGARSETSS
jgi:urease subunit gamma/beta